jgi:16S rRNA C1402 (ribose-2'-O) methylase RsmI
MLILLDIDGVMVPATPWKRPEILDDGFMQFSHKACIALNKIIEETNANILLTTSHKSSYTLTQWKEILNERNITVQKIMKLNDNVNYLNRREEITNWFQRLNEQMPFIIIDDDKSLNTLPNNLKAKLIQTSATVGLTEELANEAIDNLQSQELTIA